MVGAVLIVVALVVVLPVSFLVGGAVVAAVLTSSLHSYGNRSHEGSELIDLNV